LKDYAAHEAGWLKDLLEQERSEYQHM